MHLCRFCIIKLYVQYTVNYWNYYIKKPVNIKIHGANTNYFDLLGLFANVKGEPSNVSLGTWQQHD